MGKDLLESISKPLTDLVEAHCEKFNLSPSGKSIFVGISYRDVEDDTEGAQPSIFLSYSDEKSLTLSQAKEYLETHGCLYTSEGDRVSGDSMTVHGFIRSDWYPAPVTLLSD